MINLLNRGESGCKPRSCPVLNGGKKAASKPGTQAGCQRYGPDCERATLGFNESHNAIYYGHKTEILRGGKNLVAAWSDRPSAAVHDPLVAAAASALNDRFEFIHVKLEPARTLEIREHILAFRPARRLARVHPGQPTRIRSRLSRKWPR